MLAQRITSRRRFASRRLRANSRLFVAFDYNIRHVSPFETNGKTETSNNRYKFLETQVKGASIWGALQIGAAGAILGIANALPHACVTIWEAFRMREREAASDWQKRVAPAARLIAGPHGIPALKFMRWT